MHQRKGHVRREQEGAPPANHGDLGRNHACPHLRLELPASRSMSKYISVVETTQPVAFLLWQPKKTHYCNTSLLFYFLLLFIIIPTWYISNSKIMTSSGTGRVIRTAVPDIPSAQKQHPPIYCSAERTEQDREWIPTHVKHTCAWFGKNVCTRVFSIRLHRLCKDSIHS